MDALSARMHAHASASTSATACGIWRRAPAASAAAAAAQQQQQTRQRRRTARSAAPIAALGGACRALGGRSCSRPTAAAVPGRLLPARGRSSSVAVRAERKEYFDFKDMPPLPLGVKRIVVPELDYVVVDKSTEELRMASLAIFYDIWGDDQYGRRLTRRSAITALCMYDRDDVSAAERSPGDYPNIDLLQRVYKDGLDLAFEVEEYGAPGSS